MEDLSTFLHSEEHGSISGYRPHQTWAKPSEKPPPAPFIHIQLPSTVYNPFKLPLTFVHLLRLHGGLDDVTGVVEEPVEPAPYTTGYEEGIEGQVIHCAPLRGEIGP